MNRIQKLLIFFSLIGSYGLFAQSPTVTVLTPNGGEVWSGATTQNITWSSVNIANVILEYSTNNGSTWLNITVWPASAQTYAWVVPGAGPSGSTQCLVRIYDALNTLVVDQSDNTFTIPPSSITLLQPNGGEQWPVGSLQAIVWQHNSILDLDIEYSTNNGGNWISIANNVTALRSFYNWVIPSTVSSNCIVRVKDATNPLTVNDISNSVFSIIPTLSVDVIKYRGGSFDGFTLCENSTPAITLTSPNGGEVWPGATVQNITWTYNNIPNNVLIEVSYNNGSSWTSITTWPASAQLYPWVVSGIGSTQCLVRVSDAQNSLTNDISNNTFTIPIATIQVVQPNGGEQWPVGSLQSIVWNSQSVNDVNIDYSTNNGGTWVSVATNQNAQRGFYNWTIPSTVSTNCLVRVTDASNGSVTDNSNAVFSIITALVVDPIKYRGGSFDGFTLCSNTTPAITVTSPNGGEIWSGATTQNIDWTYNNISNNVLIEYSTNNGSNWITITTWPVTAGTYLWQVPGAGPLGSTQCLVRVSDAQNLSLSDQSNNTFTIPGSSVTVVQPNGGEQWPVGSLQAIVWNVQSVLTVNIEYSTNNGTNWITLATNYQSAIGFFNWVIPNTVSGNCLVRVSDFSNITTVNDVSNNVFSIITALVVNAGKYYGGSYDGFTVSYTGCVPPAATMTGNQSICSGQTAQISVNFSGSGPYNITYTDGTTPVSISGISANPYVMSFTPLATTSYSITALSNTCINGPVSGSALVSISAGPSASLSGSHTICSGQGASLSVVITGSTPWTLTWTDGSNPSTQSGITTSPYIINLSPTQTTSYSLVSVSSPSCPGGLVSGTGSITVQPGPDVALSGGGNLCLGNTSVLTFQLSGNAPWDLVYTDGSSTTTQLGLTANPYLVTVTPAGSGTYSLISLSNSCGPGTLSGTAPFTMVTPPTATLSGNQTICAGSNAMLSVALTGNNPWDFTWTDGTNSFNETFINSSPYLISLTPAQSGSYSLVSVTNGCAGTISGSAQVQVTSGPTATLSGSNTLCGTGTLNLNVALTGTSPWTISWSDGTNIQTVTGINSSPHLIPVSPLQSTSYTLVSVSTLACPNGIVSGSAWIQVSSVPTASLSGTQTICAGFTAILTVSLTGSSPWDFTWTDGTNSFNETFINSSPYLISITPAQSGSYSLVSVTNGCAGTISGSAQVHVTSVPTATLSGSNTLCGTGTLNLNVALTGTSPWSISWSDGTNTQTATGISTSPYLIPVSPLQSTSYTLVSVSTLACPNGIVSGSAWIQVSSVPTASLSGTQTICAGFTAILTVSLTGSSPWDFTWTDGTNSFNETFINSSPYLISLTPVQSGSYSLVSVTNGCAGSISGSAQVQVTSGPTATLSGSNTLCGTGTLNLNVALTGTSPWSISWSDGTNIQTVTGINSSPHLIPVSPLQSTSYTLVSVSTLACPNGIVSGSAWIQVSSVPTASLSGTQTICTGFTAILTVSLTGSSPWDLTYTDGLSPVNISGITSTPYFLSVTPIGNTTYQLTALNTICTGNVSGQALITVHAAPSANLSGTQTICGTGSTNLSVNFTGTGPYDLIWTDGITPTAINGISNNPFIFTVTPSGNTTYSLVSVSSPACSSGAVSGTAILTVLPAPSASLSGSQSICPGGNVNLTFTLAGTAPWDFTWTDGVNPVTILSISNSPYIISVSPGVNTTYSLQQVQDACGTGTVSGVALVHVFIPPSAVLSGQQTICTGGQAQLSLTFTGSSPWNFSWTDGTNPQSVSGITSSPYFISVSPVSQTTYSLISVTDICSGSVSGTAVVTLSPGPAATLSGSQTLCTGQQANLSVNLSGNQPWSLTWTDGTTQFVQTGINTNPYLISVTPLVNTTYSLVQVSSTGCVSTNVSGNAIVNIQSSPTASLSGSNTICAGQSSQLTISLTGNSPWSFTYTDGSSFTTHLNISVNPFIINISPASTRTYSLSAVSNSCGVGTYSGTAALWVIPTVSATLSGSQTICTGGSANLSFQLAGSAPWDLTWTDGINTIPANGITASPYIVSVSPTSITTYVALTVNANTCNGQTFGSSVVDVIPGASMVLSGNQTICPGNQAQMSFTLSGNSPWNISWTDGTTLSTQNGITISPYIVSISPMASVTYTPVSLTNACGAGTFSGQAEFQVTTLATAQLSGTQTLCAGDGITLSVNLTGDAPWSLTWSNGVNSQTVTGITGSPWVLIQSPGQSTTYSLVSVSSGNCNGTVSGNAIATLSPQPTAGISGSNSLCPGQTAQLSITLNGPSPWDFAWSDGTNTYTVTGISTSPYFITVSPLVNTTYSLVNISSGACSGTVSGSAILTLQTGPTAQIQGGQTICAGQQSTLSVTFTGSGPWNLTWSDGLNNFTQNTITTSPWIFTVSPAQSRTYTLTGVSDPSCPLGTVMGNGAVITVNPMPSPAVVSSHQSICTQSFIISANTPTAGSGIWTVTAGTGTVLFPTNPNSNVTSLSPGMNSFIWTVSLGSCTSSAQMNIFRALPPAPAQAGASQLICGSTVLLSGNTPTNNGSGTWSFVTGGGIIANPNQPNTQVNNLAPGTTIFKWTISNGICPATEDTLTVVSALFVTPANAGANQTICVPSANINGNAANPGFGVWTLVNGTGTIQNPASATTTVTGLGMGSTVLVWTLRNAGCVSSDTVIITQITRPVASYTYVQSGYTFNFTNTSQNAVSAFWTFGDGNSSTLMDPVHTYLSTAVYTVRLIVANGCGSDTSIQTIGVYGVNVEEEIEAGSDLRLWPNPATDQVQVLLESHTVKDVRLELLDMLGHKVLVSGRQEYIQEGVHWTIDLSGLTKGLYMVRVYYDEQERVLKFVLY